MPKTNIEWATKTWNPLEGCRKISPGCDNCYADRLVGNRMSKNPIFSESERRLYSQVVTDNHFNGQVRLFLDRLQEPYRWKKPQRIFVCSRSDIFHGSLSHHEIDQIFAVMTNDQNRKHSFLMLTKRPRNMLNYLQTRQPLLTDNLWFGVTAENQDLADDRIPVLLEADVPHRWISVEPMLSHVNVFSCLDSGARSIEWVVAGGESGPNARPCSPKWIRHLRNQCSMNGVPFYFKQWGEWLPTEITETNVSSKNFRLADADGVTMWRHRMPRCLLDGIEYKNYPEGMVQ